MQIQPAPFSGEALLVPCDGFEPVDRAAGEQQLIEQLNTATTVLCGFLGLELE